VVGGEGDDADAPGHPQERHGQGGERKEQRGQKRLEVIFGGGVSCIMNRI